MIRVEHNVKTGEISEIPLTDKEIKEIEKLQSEAQQAQAETQAKATARAAILDRLGLTAEEARLLLS
jgi:hypothetical protein